MILQKLFLILSTLVHLPWARGMHMRQTGGAGIAEADFG
jgi:hypothetical protein